MTQVTVRRRRSDEAQPATHGGGGTKDAINAVPPGTRPESLETLREFLFLAPRARRQQQVTLEVDGLGVQYERVAPVGVGKMIGTSLHAAATISLVGGDKIADIQFALARKLEGEIHPVLEFLRVARLEHRHHQMLAKET